MKKILTVLLGIFVVVNVVAQEAPVIISLTADTMAVCSGEYITLTATVSDDGEGTFEWTGGDVINNGATARVYNPDVENGKEITYTVTYTSTSGIEAEPKNINVIFYAVPTAPKRESFVSYCEDAVIEPLTAEADEGGILYWYGTNATGGVASTTAPIPSPSDSGDSSLSNTIRYYVSQQSIYGCESLRASINVNFEKRPEVTISRSLSKICEGDENPTFTASENGLFPTLALVFYWYEEEPESGSEIKGTDNTFIPSFSEPGYHDVWVKAKNYYYSKDDCSSIVMSSYKINSIPSPPIVIQQPIICEYEDAPLLEADGENIKWYLPDTILLIDSGLYQTTDMSVGLKKYYATQTVDGCESAPAVVSFSVLEKAASPKVSTTTIYRGENLEAEGSPNMQWGSLGNVDSGLNPPKPYASVGTTYHFDEVQDLEVGTYRFSIQDILIYDSENRLGCSSENDTIEVTIKSLEIATIPDIQVEEGDTLPILNLLEYITKDSTKRFTYKVKSSNDGIVYPFVMGDKLGFVQYGTGTAVISFFVTIGDNIIAKSAFNFTIKPKSEQQKPPCNLTISSEITNATCNAVANGEIEISVSGGAEPYQYKWTTGRTSSGIYNVRAGSYSVLVVDSLGCTATETFFVSEPSAVAVYEEITNPACGQNNGSISLRVFGGTEPYLYAWEGSTQTTSTIDNLSADNYTVTVTDGNYCTVTKTFSLTEIGAPIIANPIVTPSKCNEPLGSVQIAVSGGTGELTFEWNDSTKVANNLFRPRMYAGDYKLKVTDGNNCHATMYVTVPQIPFKQPEIALVSYGDTARHNLVVWQKENTNDIDYYNIYRETEYGNYEKIGTSAYKETSIFIDETADFKTKSSRYRLSASNKCWESPLSKEYKTILLQWEKNGNGSLDLWWDAYEGCEYVKYSILRLTCNGIDKFKDIPANKVRYTINNVEEGTIGFFISVELISQVDVTKPMKSESGPFIIVVSNIAELENRDAVDDIAENQVLAFGGDKSIFVNNANGEDVIVCDLTGKTIVRKQNVDFTTIPVKTAGVYIVIVVDRLFKVVVR